MITIRTILEKLIYLFTFSLLFFSPLLIGGGSAKPWTKLVLQIQCFLLFILWLLWSSYEERGELNSSTRSHLLLLAFLFICLFQIIPLPGFILGTVSQKSLEIWERSQSVLSSIGFNRGNSMFTISLYPHGTWKETLLLLSYFAFGFVISRMFTTERQIKFLLIPVFGVLLFEAAYGIYQYLNRDVTLPLEVQYARGTFLNRNHFAGFLEMSLPLVLGYALSLRGKDRGKQKSFFKTLSSSDNLIKQILLLFLIGIMFLALFFSKSRMGIFSALLSLLFFYLVYSSLKKSKLEKAWVIFFVLAIAILYGLWIGLSPIFERFLQIGSQAPGRVLVWKDTLGIIKDFPFFGTGLGTFGYVYPLYEKSMEQAVVYIHAHNDYLQVMAETGLLGFLFIFIALVLFILSSLRTLSQLSQKGDYFRFFMVLGALSGIISLL